MRSLKMHQPDTGRVAEIIEAVTIVAAEAFIALVFVGGILLGMAI